MAIWRSISNAVESGGSPALVRAYHGVRSASESAPAGQATLVGRPLEEVEKYYIAETLKLTNGNREEAARTLGIGERTLYRKIKQYGLEV